MRDAVAHPIDKVLAEVETAVQVEVTSSLGGTWLLTRNVEWKLADWETVNPKVIVRISPQIAWKLFSKNVRPADIMKHVVIAGDQRLGHQVLEMVSVMA